MAGNWHYSAQKFIKVNKRKRKSKFAYAALGLIVAASVVMSLIMPGLSNDVDYTCGLPEHTHAQECFVTYLCDTPENHEHGEECYGDIIASVCGLEAHAHDETCLELVCGYEEGEEVDEGVYHAHGDACWAQTCDMEEHVHGDSCNESFRALVCGIPENHVHSAEDGCFTVSDEPLCGMIEHAHTEACLSSHMQNADDAEDEDEDEADVATETSLEAAGDEVEPEPEGKTENTEKLDISEKLFYCSICDTKMPLHGHGGGSEFVTTLSPMYEFTPFSLGDRWDLSNYTIGVVIRDMDGNVIPNNGSVYLGTDYRLTITFMEKPNLQFAYKTDFVPPVMVYQLPNEIIVPIPIPDQDIYGKGVYAGEVIGHYNVTTTGLVSVWFETKTVIRNGVSHTDVIFELYTDLDFFIDILSQIEYNEKDVDIYFGNDVDVEVTIVDDKAVLDLVKASLTSFNPVDKTVSYTATITASDGPVTMFEFYDVAQKRGGGNQSLGILPDPGYLDFTKIDVKLAGVLLDENDPAVNPTDYKIGWRSGSNPPVLEITWPNGITIQPGDANALTVTYTFELESFINANYSGSSDQPPKDYTFTVHNEAYATYNDVNNYPKIAHDYVNVIVTDREDSVIVSTPSSLSKKVCYTDEDTLQYTITINVPANRSGLQFYIYDTLRVRDTLTFDTHPVLSAPINLQAYFGGVLFKPKEGIYNYSYYVDDSDNTLYICFNGSDTSTNSRWPTGILTPTVITIIYEIPLSAPLLDLPSVTLGEYLKSKPEHVVTNDSGTSVPSYGHQSETIDWPIFKNLNFDETSIKEDAEVKFDYEVRLDPFNDLGSAPIPFFKATEPAMFFDRFDSRLEFVPGSFTAELISGAYTYIYEVVSTTVFENIGNMISVDLGTLKYKETLLSGVLLPNPQPYPAPGVWYATALPIIIKYTLKLDPYVREHMIEPLEFDNVAGIEGHSTYGGTFESKSTVKYGKKPVDKDMLEDPDNQTLYPTNDVNFEVTINPYGRTLGNGDCIVVTDRMSASLAFYLTSMDVYKETTPGSGVWDWQPMVQTNVPDTGIKWSWTYNVAAAGRDPEIVIVLPDKTSVKIKYRARVRGVGTVPISNYVEIEGKYSDIFSTNWKARNTTSGGNMSSTEVILFKYDDTDSLKLLNDAEFALYIGWPSGYSFPTPRPVPSGVVPTFTHSGFDFYFIEYGITATNGSFKYTDDWLSMSNVIAGAVYALREYKAPPGYRLMTTDIVFRLAPPTATQTSMPFIVVTDHVDASNTPYKARVILNGEKILRGIFNANNPPIFDFDLYQYSDENATYPVPSGEQNATASSIGKFKFDLGLMGPGTYWYQIMERNRGLSGWAYDDTYYMIRVTVTPSDNTSYALRVDVDYRTKEGASGTWSEWLPIVGTSATAIDGEYVNDPGPPVNVVGSPIKITFTNTRTGPRLPETGGNGSSLAKFGFAVVALAGLLSLAIFMIRDRYYLQAKKEIMGHVPPREEEVLKEPMAGGKKYKKRE